MNKIEEIEPEPEMEQKIKSDAAELEDIQEWNKKSKSWY